MDKFVSSGEIHEAWVNESVQFIILVLLLFIHIPVEWKQMTNQPCQIAVLPSLPRWVYWFDASRWIDERALWGDLESPLSRVYSSNSISFLSTGGEGEAVRALKFRIYFRKCISVASALDPLRDPTVHNRKIVLAVSLNQIASVQWWWVGTL